MLMHSVASLGNAGATATVAEAQLSEKYRKLKDNVYIFLLMTLEVPCSLGESSEISITRLCKMLCCSRTTINEQAAF